MYRFYTLILLSVLPISIIAAKPVKKMIKKDSTLPVSAPEIKKDTTSVAFTEAENAAFRAKLDKANGLIYNNTTYNYISGKPSVKVGNWQYAEGKRIRKISFYDKNGVQTFELTDEMASYSLLSYIHFREDGSVDVVEVHENPGSGMYSYLISIQFTEQNMPISRYKSRRPTDVMGLQGSGTPIPADTWDAKNHSWIIPTPPAIKGMHYENGMYINDNFSIPKW